MNARAIFFVAPGAVEVGEVALPAVGEGEVLVRTGYSGISAGSELLAYRGELDPQLALDETIGALGGTFAYPFAYGYSCVGRVEHSRADLVEGSLVFAFHAHQDRFVAPAADVIALHDTDARVATLLPLVETALQLSLDAGPVEHETVVTLQCGHDFAALSIPDPRRFIMGCSDDAVPIGAKLCRSQLALVALERR